MTIKNLLLLILTLLLLCFRPSIFGESYNVLVFILFFATTVIICATGTNRYSSINQKLLTVAIVIYICVFYFLIQGLILSTSTQTVINSSLLLLLTVPCIALVVDKHQDTILRTIINFHYFLSISAIITFLIYITVGFSIDRLPIVASLEGLIDYKAAGDGILHRHVMFFPYSVAWTAGAFLNIEVPRFVGIYREPGMSQIFYVTAFILTFFVPVKNVVRKRAVLALGTILLFSTAGFVNLVFVIFVLIMFNTTIKGNLVRILKNPIFIVLAIVAFVFLSRETVVMIGQKIDDVSGMTRLESFEQGIQRLMERPFFGEGYYNTFRKDESGKVISEGFIGILGVSYQLGFVGILLYFLCWTVSLNLRANRRALCVYVACFMTLVFSQPSYNDIFTWFLLMLNTRDFSVLHS